MEAAYRNLYRKVCGIFWTLRDKLDMNFSSE